MGAQRPSSVTTAQSLQYYAFSNELVHDKQAKSIIDNDYRQRWQAPDVPAELAKRVICACIREICFFRFSMGPKSHKFSSSLLTRHLYTRQLACEPQTGSRWKVDIHKHAGCCCCFYCAFMHGQAMLKIHGNLNKGASGSMKLT